MKKYIALIFALSFVFAFNIQTVEPVSAAKLKVVDKGSVSYTDPDEGTFTYSWKTYQKGTSYVKIIGYVYSQKYNYGTSMTYYLQKVSKKKLKISMSAYGHKTNIETVYTKTTAARYYWNVFRPMMTTIPDS
ncbi:MAG TPA: hypothetical protein VK426_06905 [Methanobacterium sp.]|nr:hypothetical protein [Methanobacterium sp.]